MKVQMHQIRWLAAFGLVTLAMVGVEWAIVGSVAFWQKPDLVSLGVTVDLTLGLPILYYFLVVRKARISWLTLLAVLALSGLVASIVLPEQYHRYLGYWEVGLALAEAGMVGLVVLKGRVVLRRFRQLQAKHADFIGNIQASLTPVIDNDQLTSLLVSELSVIRYGLFGWMGTVEKTAGQTVFSTHRESGHEAFVSALLLVGLVETGLLHLFVARWSPGGAIAITLLGCYGLLFFVADTVALIKRPALLDGNSLRLRFGLRWQADCSLANIEHLSAITGKPAKARDTLIGSFITPPTVLLTLREPILVQGLYGVRRSVRRIAFAIDQRDEFIKAIKDRHPLIL